MITIIHGSNQMATRNQLQIFKNRFQDIVTIDGANFDQTLFLQSVESQSLFGQNRLVVTEGLFSSKTSKEWLISYLEKNNTPIELVFWEDREIKSKDLFSFGTKAKIISLNLPVFIFKFLDELHPKKMSLCLQYYNLIVEKEGPEIVFFMLVRQFRYLILTKTASIDGPIDYQRLAPWQKLKLTKQASLFSLDDMQKIYENLIEIDYCIKKGRTKMMLTDEIKLLLLKMS